MSSYFQKFSKAGSGFLGAILVFGGLGTVFFLPTPVFAANPVRVYVAGESIERRNCFANAPFTSSGALNRPTDDNDTEYGWMIPMAERLKLRQSGLGVRFVGTQPWAAAEDYDYNPTECGFVPTPGQTSAISGSSVDSWIADRAAELTARTYCYDVAFASRGGNDGSMSHEEYRNQLKDLVRRLAHGSSCQTNPIIYVTGHMPDNQGSVSSLRARFSTDPQQAVNELRVSDPGLNVRFIDIFSAFASNRPTTAFPSPSWLSSSNAFNIARIGRDGDGLHPRRLSSIYAGEIVADAININEFMWGGSSSGSGTTAPPPPTPAPAPAPTPVPTPTPAPVLALPVAAVGHYDIGHPTLRDIWVDPTNGRDTNSGADRAHALRSFGQAVRLIPTGQTLTGTGYRLMLTRGEYLADMMPNYWENYLGTAQFPIIIQAADGQGTAVMRKDINAKNVRYFYLIDLNFERPEDLLHFEQGDHVLLRGLTLRATAAHETLKVNQSKYLYVEDSDISGADDNAIDFVAVQYGHIIGNKIHNANDWCMYTKGGSAMIRIEGNEIYDCGVGGYTAGQGTGFQYMTPPWIYYEASDIKFVNNVVHDTGTAGIGVNGGYNILFAYNTLYRVGIGHRGNHSDHLFEANFGGQGCDDTAERSLCATNRTAGGWGLATPGQEVSIPNKNIYVYNNLFVNPAGTSAPYLFQVASSHASTPGTGMTGILLADENLQIKGNIISDSSEDIGLGESTGCTSSNPTCNPSQIRRDNQFIHTTPSFVNAGMADLRLSAALSLAPVAIPSFPGGDRPTSAFPVGELSNGIAVDRGGNARNSNNSIGAYIIGATSAVPVSATSPSVPAPTTEPAPRPEPLPAIVPVAPTDLSVALYATPYPTVEQGSTASYRVTVMNLGPSVATNATVRIFIPTLATFVATRPAQSHCSFVASSRELVCSLGDLQVKDMQSFSIVLRATNLGRLEVRATIVSRGGDLRESDNASRVAITVTGSLANLQGTVRNTTQTCRRSGAQTRCTIRSTITVRNVGSRSAPASRLTITILSDDGRTINTQNISVPAIKARGSRNYTINRVLGPNTRGATLSGMVDATNRVRESNESDNRIEAKLP